MTRSRNERGTVNAHAERFFEKQPNLDYSEFAKDMRRNKRTGDTCFRKDLDHLVDHETRAQTQTAIKTLTTFPSGCPL